MFMAGTSLRGVILAGAAAAALVTLPAEWAGAQGQGQGGASAGAGQGGMGGGDRGQRGGSAGQGGGRDLGGILADDGEDDGDDTPDWAGERGGNPDRGADTVGQGGRPADTGGRPPGVGGGDADSDRPEWAGVPGGSAGRGAPPNTGDRGDEFGDLYVILRDDQGVPILSEDGFVQPIAADGTLIPLDEEGHVIEESLVQEVEIGRLNVSRAPNDVLDNRSSEVIDVLNAAEELALDPAGRLTITIDGETRTIDSPLENLAIYVSLMTTGTIDGVDDLPGDAFDFMVDGQYTAEDLAASASFLAAATDKSGEFTTDEIAYVNNILGINTTSVGDVTYSDVDYSDFVYDREETYGDVMMTVLIPQDDGSYVPAEVNVFGLVFGGETVDVTDGTLAAYTQAADDARAVIEFVHEYEVPSEL